MIFPALLAAVLSEGSDRPRARTQELQGRLGLRAAKRLPAGLSGRMEWIRKHQPLAYPVLYLGLLRSRQLNYSAWKPETKLVNIDRAPDNPIAEGPQLSPGTQELQVASIVAWLGVKLHEDHARAVHDILFSAINAGACEDGVMMAGDDIHNIAEDLDGVDDLQAWIDGRWDMALEGIEQGMSESPFGFDDLFSSWPVRPWKGGPAQVAVQADGTILVGEPDGPRLTLRYFGRSVDPGTYFGPSAWSVTSIDGIDGPLAAKLKQQLTIRDINVALDIAVGLNRNSWFHITLPGIDRVTRVEPSSDHPGALSLEPVEGGQRGDAAVYHVAFYRVPGPVAALRNEDKDLVVLWLLFTARLAGLILNQTSEAVDLVLKTLLDDMRAGADPLRGGPSIRDATQAALARHVEEQAQQMAADLVAQGGEFAAGNRWNQTQGISTGDALPLEEDQQVIMIWPDGAIVVELTTQKHLSDEGAAMSHCVGTHGREVERGSHRILSYRIPGHDGGYIPKVTTELQAGGSMEVSDLRGPHNSYVLDEEQASRVAAMLWVLRSGLRELPADVTNNALQTFFGPMEKRSLRIVDHMGGDIRAMVEAGLQGASYP